MSSARCAGVKFARGVLTVQRVAPSRTMGAPGGWADRESRAKASRARRARAGWRGGEAVSIGNPGIILKRGDLLRPVGFYILAI